MKTRYYIIDREDPDVQILAQAADIIKQGGLVAFPTETVYGLGANGLDPHAVGRIFTAKGRPADNPLILHIADGHEIDKLARQITANARALMDRFWPGPLTVVLEKTLAVPDGVAAGLDSVAIRLPDSLIARELIRLAGVPIAAPSANVSGRPSPTTGRAVLSDMDGKIELILDGGPCGIGVESTVVDCTTPVPTLLRPGGVTLEMLTEVLGEVEIDPALDGGDFIPRSPGMKYRHYAPAAPMTLLEGAAEACSARMIAEITKAQAIGLRVGAVVSAELAALLPEGPVVVAYGSRLRPSEIAAGLYAALRHFDSEKVDVIFAEGIADAGLGLAVMNRLRKAAGYQIIKC